MRSPLQVLPTIRGSDGNPLSLRDWLLVGGKVICESAPEGRCRLRHSGICNCPRNRDNNGREVAVQRSAQRLTPRSSARLTLYTGTAMDLFQCSCKPPAVKRSAQSATKMVSGFSNFEAKNGNETFGRWSETNTTSKREVPTIKQRYRLSTGQNPLAANLCGTANCGV